jgi:hypothetical protein
LAAVEIDPGRGMKTGEDRGVLLVDLRVVEG